MEIIVGQSETFSDYNDLVDWMTELEEEHPDYDFGDSLVMPDRDNGGYYVLVNARKEEVEGEPVRDS